MSRNTESKFDKPKNFFPLPNEIFSLGLHHSEIAIYSYLMHCEDRSTYQCYPSYKTIAKHVDLSPNTVRKYVQQLEEHGLIRTEHTSIITKDGRKRNGSLMYTILPIQSAVDLYHARQMAELERTSSQQKAQAKAAKMGLEFTLSCPL